MKKITQHNPVLAFAFFVLLLSTIPLNGQTLPGTIKGVLVDKARQERLPFASVILSQDSLIIARIHTDLDGRFILNPLNPGTYDISFSFVGYSDLTIQGVVVEAGHSKEILAELDEAAVLLQEVVIEYEEPIIDGTKTSRTVTSEDLVGMAPRSINGVSSQTSGVNITQGRGYDPYEPQYLRQQRRAEIGNEQYGRYVENAFTHVLASPFSTFAIDVDGGSYSNMRRFISMGTLPPTDAVRIEEFVNYFSYDYPAPEGEHPFTIHTELASCPWNENHQLLHIGIQGQAVDHRDIPTSNLVFLIDVSGSMDSPDKLPLLQSSLRLLLEKLRPNDRVAIVVYSSSAELLLPSTKASKRLAIQQAVESLRASGTTAGGAGIQLAYEVAEKNFIDEGNNRVILATDGDFNVGISTKDELIRFIEEKRESGVYLSVLGFGKGNFKEDQMEQLANHGNGNFNYIDGMLEAEKVLVREMGGTLLTIAKDVKAQLEFNPAVVEAYRLIGFENRILDKDDFEDDAKDAGELGAGHSVTAIYELVPASGLTNMHEADTRYQKTIATDRALSRLEMGVVHFRYKLPESQKSLAFDQVIVNQVIPFQESSEDFRFAAAVAEFGLLLRQSDYRQDASFDHLQAVARSARGEDAFGLRAEFIRLAAIAEGLMGVVDK